MAEPRDLTMATGPSIVGLLELNWSDQRDNVLRAFLFVFRDVAFSADDLASKSRTGLLQLVQVACARSTYKPWAGAVEALWSGKDSFVDKLKWGWSEEDSKAVLRIKEMEIKFVRQMHAHRRPCPNNEGNKPQN